MNQKQEIHFEKPNHHYSLHAAVLKNNKEEVEKLLHEGYDPNAVDHLGRTPIHCAAIISSESLLGFLIQNGAHVNSKIQDVFNHTVDSNPETSFAENKGRTALHISASQLDYNCVVTLIQQQADINGVDIYGMTPLLVIGEKYRKDPNRNIYKKHYEKIVDLFLQRKAMVNVSSTTGFSPLHCAFEFDSLNSFRTLLKSGADALVKDELDNTILHVVCKSGNENCTNELLLADERMVNLKNREGNTPLHCAALAASRSCLSLLISHGGDLSPTNASNMTVCDLIFLNVPRALNFFVEILDSNLQASDYSINDKNFTVTLDFKTLIPNDGSQTSVLTALINSLPYEQKSKVVLHPLIATFIKLKWARLKILFLVLVVIHVMFVFSLSFHVCFLIKGQSLSVHKWSRFVLLFTSTVIFIHIMTQISLSHKYYLKEFETWLTLTCISLSLTIGLWETFFMHAPLPPFWIRHLAAYNILLSWILLMFVLGRFPLMGYVALMFFTVLRNVIKVLAFFTCLVIGFSLSFCVQFSDMQFSDPWKAFVRTTIMLMGEYEYGELFKNDKAEESFQKSIGNLFVTSRIIFLLFVLLGSIVLVNLLTGLAVNDIQALRDEGCLRHMIKQAEFVSQVEKISNKNLNPKIIPNCIIKILSQMQALPKVITIHPNTHDKVCRINHKKKLKDLPPKLIELIVLSAIKNQNKKFKNQSEIILLKDAYDFNLNNKNHWVEAHINESLNDIKQDIQLLKFQLLPPKRNTLEMNKI